MLDLHPVERKLHMEMLKQLEAIKRNPELIENATKSVQPEYETRSGFDNARPSSGTKPEYETRSGFDNPRHSSGTPNWGFKSSQS
jgi:hypothetical protein